MPAAQPGAEGGRADVPQSWHRSRILRRDATFIMYWHVWFETLWTRCTRTNPRGRKLCTGGLLRPACDAKISERTHALMSDYSRQPPIMEALATIASRITERRINCSVCLCQHMHGVAAPRCDSLPPLLSEALTVHPTNTLMDAARTRQLLYTHLSIFGAALDLNRPCASSMCSIARATSSSRAST